MKLRTPAVSAVAVVALALAAAAPHARADYALLRNGQRLEITGFMREGDVVSPSRAAASSFLLRGGLRLRRAAGGSLAALCAAGAFRSVRYGGRSVPAQIRAAATVYALDPLLIRIGDRRRIELQSC